MKELAPGERIYPERMSSELLYLNDCWIGYVRGRWVKRMVLYGEHAEQLQQILTYLIYTTPSTKRETKGNSTDNRITEERVRKQQ